MLAHNEKNNDINENEKLKTNKRAVKGLISRAIRLKESQSKNTIVGKRSYFGSDFFMNQATLSTVFGGVIYFVTDSFVKSDILDVSSPSLC